LEATLQEEAGKTFAFLRDSALELAMRLNKKVHVVVRGENLRLQLLLPVCSLSGDRDATLKCS
jgi:hypothetical protein